MAEFGAHIATKAQLSRASIFELLAQENLSDSLRSAFHYLVHVRASCLCLCLALSTSAFQTLADANPGKFTIIRKWSEEVYLVFDAVVQYTHLRAFKASFPEHFYGLKRVGSYEQRLTRDQLWASFCLVCLLPYARKRLDQLLEQLRQEDAVRRLDTQTPGYYFLRLYPALSFLIEASNFVLQINYLLERSKYHSIWCQVIGTQLVSQTSVASSTPSASSDAFRWSGWLVAKYVARTIGSCLSGGAFFIQFLEYYYSREGVTTGSLMRLPKPSPPVTSLYSRVSSRASVSGH